MAASSYKALPQMCLAVFQTGPTRSTLVMPEARVYPFHLGAMVTADSSTGTVAMSGKGELSVNHYLIPCTALDYGSSPVYLPDLTRITRVVSLDSSSDAATVSPAVAVKQGEWLLDVGLDTSTIPLTDPAFDGAGFTLYEDPCGYLPCPYAYVTAGSGGVARFWMAAGTKLVDVLVCDGSGRPLMVWPHQPLTAEMAA